MLKSKVCILLLCLFRVVNRLAPVMIICGFIANKTLLIMVGIGLILYNEIIEHVSHEQWKKKRGSYKSYYKKYKDDK